MEAFSQSAHVRGLWNNPRPAPYSKETQDLLRLMMEESRVSQRHRKQINQCLQNGDVLPRFSDPTASAAPPQHKTKTRVQGHLPSRPQRRPAEACRAGSSYVRQKFIPAPTRDLEKEKRRLQNILATGQAEPEEVPARPRPEVVEEKDRYDEVVEEIEDRIQFLEDMASLGKKHEYAYIINGQIAEKMRELKMLDKRRSAKTDAVTCEERADCRTENTCELEGDEEKRRLTATDQKEK